MIEIDLADDLDIAVFNYYSALSGVCHVYGQITLGKHAPHRFVLLGLVFVVHLDVKTVNVSSPYKVL